jgi:hypothetical protein
MLDMRYACKRRSILMDKLDDFVPGHLVPLLQPEPLVHILQSPAQRRLSNVKRLCGPSQTPML